MASLFELKGEYLQLMDWMDDPEVDPKALEDTLESVKFEIVEKAEGYIQVIENFNADAEMFSKQAKLFKEKADKAEANANKLLKILKDAMEETGQTELKTDLFTIKVVANGGKQTLKIDGDVPEQYKVVKYENDNEKIRAYLDTLSDPVACTWAHLEPRGTRLSIK